jgi:hypothetical protein
MCHYRAEKDYNRSNQRAKRKVYQLVGKMKELDATFLGP